MRPTPASTCARSFPPTRLPQPEEVYRRTHERRYELLLELVRGLSPARILVVGPSHESALLRAVAPVDTFGWGDDRFPRVEGEGHYEHDLNDPAYPELGRYDVVVCAEVVEHLHVSAESVLRALGAALVPAGRLVLQTPNATSLPKRLRMLVGRNPSEPIRDEPRIPALLLAAVALSGCSGEEGERAEQLLSRAEVAQTNLRSAAFEAKIAFVMDGRRFSLLIDGGGYLGTRAG